MDVGAFRRAGSGVFDRSLYQFSDPCLFVGGQPSEVFDVASYEINPANIAEKFQNQKTFVRTKKEVN